MQKGTRKEKPISRRGLLSILSSSIFIPFLGFGNSDNKISIEPNIDEYEILLKPDGTTVKVKKSVLNKSKVIEKNISNKSFLSWLGRKL